MTAKQMKMTQEREKWVAALADAKEKRKRAKEEAALRESEAASAAAAAASAAINSAAASGSYLDAGQQVGGLLFSCPIV